MTIKGQVEVPRQIRDRLGLKSGDKMAFTHVAERRHRRHATQDPASGRAGRLAHPAWAPSGFDRGHEPVQGAGRNESGEAIVAGAISGLLESSGVEFEHPPTVEESLYVGAQHPAPISPTACSRHAPPISAAAHS